MPSLQLSSTQLRVRGTVQGVGFRPTVYRLALECNLQGEVSNDSDGVLIQIRGTDAEIATFTLRLRNEAPPLSRIESIEVLECQPACNEVGFRIIDSTQTNGMTDICADAASCQQCINEMMNPLDRRYLYPFTNCTHCGPRLSIVEGIPYDRKNTTMRTFELCPACRSEYNNPLDRRFHAQPVACNDCGPQLVIHGYKNEALPSERSARTALQIQHIVSALKAGKIVAIKGLGGFHLSCDATNESAVDRLRQRKQRYAKPLALMSQDLDGIRRHCEVSAQEELQLRSPAAPIVLLIHKPYEPRSSFTPLSKSIAPGSRLLGFMLPYTPLHHLICRQFGGPLVMTSGNLSGEPQIIDDQEAITKLSAVADLIVYHNRKISNRIDDSVVRCIAGRPRILRRARGYAPQSIVLPAGFEAADGILAYGAELKSTFCLVKQGSAILAQHQGDLEDLTTFDDFERNLRLYKSMFAFTARMLAYDMHPDYISSNMARSCNEAVQLPVTAVQHHHAHIASAMAENAVPLDSAAVLGIALDGLGFGLNGELWGGEFLLTTYDQCLRVARLKPIPMPGGVQAATQPWRNTVAQILNSMSWESFVKQYGESDFAKRLESQRLNQLLILLAKRINSPAASSAGRLFDAVAAALDLHAEKVDFEGQAAIALEMLALSEDATEQPTDAVYEFSFAQIEESGTRIMELDSAPLWPSLFDDLQRGISRARIARRFHCALVKAILNAVDRLRHQHAFSTVVLSGGCMQNAIILEGLQSGMQERQLECLVHEMIPPNDAGIAFGQAVVAAAIQLTAARPQPASMQHFAEEFVCA